MKINYKQKNPLKPKYAILVGLITIAIFVAFGLYKCNIHSETFNDSAKEILKDTNRGYIFLSTLEKGKVVDVYKITLLGGPNECGTLDVDGSFEVRQEATHGKVRMILWQEDGTIAYDEELGNDWKKISIPKGEYNLEFVGDWYIGNVQVKN